MKISIDRKPGKIVIQSGDAISELTDSEVKGFIAVLKSALESEAFHFEFDLNK